MRHSLRALLAASVSLVFVTTAQAQTWNGTTDSLWGTAANWSTSAVPLAGATATFNNAGNSNVNLDLGGVAQPIGTILFDTASAAAYTFSGNTGDAFVFSAAGGITANATVTTSQMFNTPLQFLGAFTATNNGTGLITLNGGISLAGGGTAGLMTVSGTGNTNVNGVIAAGAITGLTKNGTGTLTLTGQSLYTGITTLALGTIQLNGGNDRLLPTSVFAFTGASGSLGVNANSQTFANITVPAQLTGAYTIGGTGGTVAVAGTGVTLQIGPGGALATNFVTTVNMATLSNFSFTSTTGTLRVGLAAGVTNTPALGQVATLTLGGNNTITAANVLVADQGASNDGGIATINFGTANVFNVTTVNIANTRSDANVQFASGLTNPTITFRGLTGGTSNVTNFNMGNPATFSGAAQATFTSTANFSLGSIDGNFTNMLIGNADGGAGTTRVGVVNATFTQGLGTVNVTNLNLGRIAGTVSTGATAFTGNGTFTLNAATGVLNATTVNFTTNLITATGASTRNVSGTLNLLNGTVRSTTWQRGAQTGNATATVNFNWTTGVVENTSGANLAINNIPVNLLTTATHTFSATGSNTITLDTLSIISGATFGITKIGPGTLIYNAVNTYSGGTTFNGGTVRTNAGSTLGALAAPATFGGGSLDLNSTNQTVGVLSGTAGSITNSATATASILTAGTAANSTFTGNFTDGAGTIGLTKVGAGTLILNGANTNTGAITVNAGTLNYASAFNSTTSLTVNAGSTFSLTNGAGNNFAGLTNLSFGVGTGAVSFNLQLDTPTTSDRFTTSGAAVTGAATNTIVLNFTALGGFGVGTYPLFNAPGGLTSGGIDYSLGTLPPGFGYNLLESDTAISLDVFTIVPTNGPIYWNGAVNSKWNEQTAGSAVNFASNPAGTTPMVGLPNSTNTVNFSAVNVTAANTITNTIETNFTINDLIFNNETGTGAVTAITIGAGVVPTSTLTILPSASTTGITVQTGAPATIALTMPIVINAVNQTWTVTDALTSLTVSGGLTGSANITTAGSGSLFLNNVGTAYTGNIAAGNSAVSFGGTVATTISGVVSGTAAILKADAGTVTFGSTNTYTGSTTLLGGTLAVNGIADGGVNSGIGASTSAATNLVFNGGFLSIAGALNSTNRNITVSAGGGRILLGTEGSTLNLNGTLTGAGTFTIGGVAVVLGGTSTINLNGDSSAGFTGNFNHYTGNLVVKSANAFGSGVKTLEFVASTPSLMRLNLDGSGGDIVLPANFTLVTSSTTSGNGIYSIAGNNTIAGNINLTLGNGNSTFYANAGASLTLSGTITILTGQVTRGITIGGAGTGFITGNVVDNGTALTSITKNADAGTWTVTGIANTYTGNTTVIGGTLKAGNDNALSIASRLFFGDQSAGVGTFDTNGFNAQFNGLSAQTNNVTGASLLIGSGKEFTINGSTAVNVVNIGSIATATVSTTRLNVSGAGTLTVNDATRNIVVAQLVTVTGANSPAILDLSALGTFNATVTNVYVGRPTAAAGTAATTSSAEAAQFLLAGSNTLNASGNFVVGHLSFSSGVTNSGTVRLGTVNTLNVGQWVLGGGRANGTLNYQTGLTNPTAILRGAAGGTTRTNVTLGDQANATGVSGGGGSTVITGTMDFSLGSVDALFDTFVIGNGAVVASNAFGRGNGTFTMSAGIVDVNTLIMARNVSGNVATTATNSTVSVANLNVSGGTFTVNTAATLGIDQDVTNTVPTNGIQDLTATITQTGGTITIGSVGTPVDITLGTHTSTNTGTNTVLIAVNGGTFTVNGNILSGLLGSGINTTTVSLAGGSLNLTGHTIGSTTNPITNVTLQTGTLSDVLEINGGATGVVKNTAGTLTLAGVNSYTGATTVSNGTLLVTGNNVAATGAVAVTGGTTGGTLRGTGTLGGAVTVSGGAVPGVIRGGASIGTLTLGNGLTVNAGGTIFVEIALGATSGAPSTGASTTGTLPNNPLSNNYLNISGGVASIDPGTLLTIDGTGVSFTQTEYSYAIGKALNDQTGVNITTAGQFTFVGFSFTPTNVSLTGDIGGNLYLNFSNPIPEPALLLGVALIAGLGLRRRR